MTESEITPLLKQNQSIHTYSYVKKGNSILGFATYDIVFNNQPTKFKVVFVDPASNLAVLETY